MKSFNNFTIFVCDDLKNPLSNISVTISIEDLEKKSSRLAILISDCHGQISLYNVALTSNDRRILFEPEHDSNLAKAFDIGDLDLNNDPILIVVDLPKHDKKSWWNLLDKMEFYDDPFW